MADWECKYTGFRFWFTEMVYCSYTGQAVWPFTVKDGKALHYDATSPLKNSFYGIDEAYEEYVARVILED